MLFTSLQQSRHRYSLLKFSFKKCNSLVMNNLLQIVYSTNSVQRRRTIDFSQFDGEIVIIAISLAAHPDGFNPESTSTNNDIGKDWDKCILRSGSTFDINICKD